MESILDLDSTGDMRSLRFLYSCTGQRLNTPGGPMLTVTPTIRITDIVLYFLSLRLKLNDVKGNWKRCHEERLQQYQLFPGHLWSGTVTRTLREWPEP